MRGLDLDEEDQPEGQQRALCETDKPEDAVAAGGTSASV